MKWFNPVFQIQFGEIKALTDGHIMFVGETQPKWKYEKHPNPPKVATSGKDVAPDYLKHYGSCTVPITPITTKKGGSIKVVWFSNAAPLDERYYKMVSKFYPAAEWFSATENYIQDSTPLEVRSDGKTVAFVMPMRFTLPTDLQPKFEHLKRTWYGVGYDFSGTKTEESLYCPQTNYEWFTSESKMREWLAEQKAKNESERKAISAKLNKINALLEKV